jgi:hypothetical protein
VAATYSHSFKPNPVFGAPQDCTTQLFVRCSEVATTALGVELGPVLRFGPGFELRGGVGIHRLWGSTGVTYYTYSGNPQNPYLGPFQARFSYAITAPGAFVGLHYADIVTRWARIRFGIEGRRLFGATVTFPELQRTIDVGSKSFGVVFGLELPSAAPQPRPTSPPAG